MASKTPSAQTDKPTFVFNGTIAKLRAATMKQAPVDGRTAVVHVDAVVEAPADMSRLAGHDITVQLASGSRASAGQRLVFHTIPLMFGDSVLVKSLAQEPVSLARAAMAAGNPVARKAAHDVRDRFADADMVVSGHVVSISLPESERAPATGAMRAARAPSKTARVRPISEHDPKWREAMVEVDEVQKGQPSTRTISVRFPASDDVRWYKAPKFAVGQRGYFMLKKAAEAPAAPAAAAGRSRGLVRRGGGAPVYTALHPADFQPLSEGDVIDEAKSLEKPGRRG